MPSPSLLRNATARVAAPSVCFAVACILLAAAPTAPPCFRRWRRSSPLLPKGEALASRATSYWTPEVQYGAKKRASLQRAAASGQRTLSSCRWPRQQGTTVHETNKLCASRGNLTGLPKVLRTRVAAPSIRGASLASCWPLPQQRLPVSATGGGRRCCPLWGSCRAKSETERV